MPRGFPTNGPRIKELRLKKVLSVPQLAEQTGLGSRTIETAEKGGALDAESVGRIAEVLGVRPADLVAREGIDEEPATCDLWDKLLGRWAGRIEQPSGPDGIPYRGELTIEFDAPGSGCYTFDFAGTRYQCAVEVTWLFERYFKCDARDPAGGWMVNTAYVQITAAWDRLVGRYVGFGPHSNGVVCGELTAVKVAPATPGNA
jgi:transcriptional regulator with XRE-family HTH domain